MPILYLTQMKGFVQEHRKNIRYLYTKGYKGLRTIIFMAKERKIRVKVITIDYFSGTDQVIRKV